jgi:hypothetical protein
MIKELLMHRFSVWRFALALASSFAVVYLGCVWVMLTVSKETAIQFFNSILHGVDVTPIMRWEMPWWEMVIGVLEVFILGWLFGALMAVIYNLGGAPEETER